jgi:hypothetical protein
LRAVLAHAGTIDRVWRLGDILGYGPHPKQTIAVLRSSELTRCAAKYWRKS